MSAETEQPRTSAPAWMPPPPPGTGLTTGTRPAQPAAAQPAAAQPTAPQPAAEQPAVPADEPRRTAPSARPGLGATLTRGAVWGALGMGAAALLQMWAAALEGDLAVRPLRLMVTLIEGGPGLVDGNPLVGILINTLIGIVLGILFALVAPRLRSARAVLVGALVLGAGVFAVDAYLVSSQLPLLDLRNDAQLLAVRLVMGAVLAIGFVDGGLSRRS